jgi:hypothetical protein
MRIDDTASIDRENIRSNRRRFLGHAGELLATSALAAPAAASAQTSDREDFRVATSAGIINNRTLEAFNLRVSLAAQDSLVPAARNVSNGDDVIYPDKGGTFTKGLPHDGFGRVDLNAYATLKNALASGKFSDFEKIVMGGTRTLNNPQSGLAFDLCALDNAQFGQPIVPPAPPIAGDQTATELLEHYWAALLHDVAFTDYGSNPLAAMAAAELSALPQYFGPRNNRGQVTTDLLFRGNYPGETLGPYLSQFLIMPTFFGAQPISQQMISYLPNIEYMLSFGDWLTVQNGGVTGLQIRTTRFCATAVQDAISPHTLTSMSSIRRTSQRFLCSLV